ncbi:MAG: hypothetical protein AAF639_05115 [Chloroflexota bacterium]
MNIRYLISVCLSVSVVVSVVVSVIASIVITQVTPAYACSPDLSTNYWYWLDYDIQADSLPPSVMAVEEHDPDEYEYRPSPIGQIHFTNESDSIVYVVPGQVLYHADAYRDRTSFYAQAIVALADALAQDEPQIDLTLFSEYFEQYILSPQDSLLYPTASSMTALMENPETPTGRTPPPQPFLYETVLIQDDQVFRVPVTITPRLNPDFIENMIVYDAPFEDYLMISDAVVLGEVVGAADDSTIVSEGDFLGPDGDPQIDGYARVQVEEWLLGDGPDVIEVGYFSSGLNGNCGLVMSPGFRGYFLLRTPNEPESVRYPLTGQSLWSQTVFRETIRNTEDIETAIDAFLEPTELPVAEETIRLFYLPYISH